MSGGDTHAHEGNGPVMHDAKENVSQCDDPYGYTGDDKLESESLVHKPDAPGMMKAAVPQPPSRKRTLGARRGWR